MESLEIMQKLVDRRQILSQSASLVAGTILLGGCSDDDKAALVNAQLEADVRADYSRGDVVICNGYVLSNTKSRIRQNHDLC